MVGACGACRLTVRHTTIFYLKVGTSGDCCLTLTIGLLTSRLIVLLNTLIQLTEASNV